ncbi:BtrH N-terminal domain-containing protein [Natrarchaeobius oligotrophus]|uniref:DUF4872 domain-containing protein n=1 Tax=Natrarchaeobius chitinivorans TaxID=1679083 RepID=A0A3N6MYV9_NATCH|nr:BtrH N-terminal domain-containing protein [Natrarchaeobius chitinivorans]RQH03301.1 DUF4872 domain-containing protein [Natrarchaeobius chitinivorans]
MDATIAEYSHGTGRHCGSTSLRNLATHYGWGCDEETCFGLAAGLGFTYFELPESPHRGFIGRPPRIEETFFDLLEIGVDRHEGEGWRTVRRRLRDSLAAGDPVMVFTDIYYLDYFGSDTHFGPHSVLCVGLEDGGDTAVLSDTEFDERQRVPLERLRQAMNSTHGVPLSNRHLVVTDPEPGRSLEEAAPDAVAEMARTMLDADRATGPDGNFGTQGLAGVRRFADELPSWVEFDDPQWSVRFAYQNVERRGTGGGAFRQLYADFLESLDGSGPALPADATERMNAIAADWTDAGETLKAASERPDTERMGPTLTDVAETVHDLADREQRLYEDLLAALESA